MGYPGCVVRGAARVEEREKESGREREVVIGSKGLDTYFGTVRVTDRDPV